MEIFVRLVVDGRQADMTQGRQNVGSSFLWWTSAYGLSNSSPTEEINYFYHLNLFQCLGRVLGCNFPVL
ncbi:hypothetical protein [Allocoleopsis franciscana]|uniref:hypothetical protein n=1 Tax=Allocoleopsis franciscana TaxID=2886352 RepID=UPI0012DE2CA1|nr:hypothetical protein [Allocoleopsis franciscana]